MVCPHEVFLTFYFLRLAPEPLKCVNLPFISQRKVDDIHVVCGLLKDFFRKLAEPLVTYELWPAFVDAASKCSPRANSARII